MVSLQVATLILAVAGVGDTVLLDFGAPWCGPCRSMEPVVAQLTAAGYPVRKVDLERDSALAAQYGVSRIPCFVLISGGREIDRFEGTADASRLVEMFRKIPAQSAPQAAQAAPRVTDARSPSPEPPLRRLFSGIRPRNLVGRGRGSRAAPAEGIKPADPFLGSPSQPEPMPGPDQQQHDGGIAQRLVAASVRLTIEDSAGFSYGSGTMIDARGEEALVLTCGHIFRDSQGKGKISVDLFTPQGPKRVPGRLVSYDLKRDVGLVAIRPGRPVETARLAPKTYRPAKGDNVVTVGCNNGADPTAVESQITSLDKFLGPANVQVAGQPVQGRSGGGLFTADGLVIGVCNAADPADNEGLFAATATIYQQLDDAHLTSVLDTPATRAAVTSIAATTEAPFRDALKDDQRLVPVPTDLRVGARSRPQPVLTSSEQATLAELRQKADGAEVICIVRSLDDPSNKSEIIVLDRASQGFLKQLAAERHVQPSANLTTMSVPNPQPATARTGAGVMR